MMETSISTVTGKTAALVLGCAALLAACQSAQPPARVAKGPLIVAPSPCADFTQSLYFEAGEATLTAQAQRLLAAAATRAHGCAVTGVDIVGLADAPGDAAANLELSRRRGDAVRAALHRRGFNKVDIKVAAGGDVGAETASGQAKPVRRRADVDFHLAAPTSPH